MCDSGLVPGLENIFFFVIKHMRGTIGKSWRLNNSIVSMLIFRFWSLYYVYVREDPYFKEAYPEVRRSKYAWGRENDKVNVVNVNIWKFWVKGIQESFVLFLQIFYQFDIISKQKVKKTKTPHLPQAPMGWDIRIPNPGQWVVVFSLMGEAFQKTIIFLRKRGRLGKWLLPFALPLLSAWNTGLMPEVEQPF